MSIIDDFLKKREKEVDEFNERSTSEEVEAPSSSLMLDSFYGQEDAITILSTATKSAMARNAAVKHVLLVGPAGTGKSRLSESIAGEVGSLCKTFLGVELDRGVILNQVFPYLHLPYARKVLFIDEIHNIPPKSAELLYGPVQDFKINDAKIIPFTLIGASTDENKIPGPLRSRFVYRIKLDLYEPNVLAGMVEKKYNFDHEIAMQIATRSRGVPRRALEYASAVEDAVAASEETPQRKHVDFMMMALGVTKDGLLRTDVDILVTLYKSSRPLSLASLAQVTELDEKDLCAIYEPFLLKLGLIERTMKGREITSKGKLYLKENAEDFVRIGSKRISEIIKEG
jgi:Holliday junction DNA helicase RuvB